MAALVVCPLGGSVAYGAVGVRGCFVVPLGCRSSQLSSDLSDAKATLLLCGAVTSSSELLVELNENF